MKQLSKNLALLMLLFFMGQQAFSHDFEVNGIFYGYDADNQTAYVTYDWQKRQSNNGTYSGSIAIPSTVSYNGRTLNVTAIGNEAFYNCKDLLLVSIPNSVTSIGEEAFEFCGIKSIDIPNSVTTISSRAFFRCNLTSLFIPNSIMTIGKDAFAHCELLETLVIEDSEIPIEIHFFNYDPFEGSNPKYVYVGRDCVSNSLSSYIPIDSRLATVFSIGKHVKSVRYTLNALKTIYSASVIPEKIEIDFLNSTYLNAKLYVPTGTKEKYMAADGWKNFFNIHEMNIEDMWDGKNNPPTNDGSKEKCEKPTIRYSNGRLLFESTTEGAICQSTITDSDIKSYSGNEIKLGVTYKISVYATATGYENSEVATATLCWIDIEPKTEGIESGVAQVRANAVLIQSHDGTVSVEGVADGTDITIYDTSGQMVGSTKAHCNYTTIATNLRNGSVAIVRVGDKSLKIIMK